MGPFNLIQSDNKYIVIKMHVVIGSMEMQQGLAFYQLRELLRVFKFFNGSEVLELLVLYAPHIHIQAYNRINSETVTKQYQQNKTDALN
jgi:hypothetical protein